MSAHGRWLPWCLAIWIAAAVPALATDGEEEEEEGNGAGLLSWAGGQLGDKLGGKVGELVSSQLLGAIGLGSDPNAPVLKELAVVEAKLDQISTQLTGLSHQLAGGLEQIGCEVQGGSYNQLISAREDDITAVQSYASLAKDLADASFRMNADNVASHQDTIRSYASTLQGQAIHDRIHDFAVGGGASGATGAVQLLSDKIRSCSYFINTDRLRRIKTQFDWLSSLQVASCSLVVNYWADQARRAGTDPDSSPDLQAAVSKCQQYVRDLQALVITSTLPDDQTAYEIGTGLLWKWGGLATGRRSCWGGHCESGSCLNETGPPCHRSDPAPWKYHEAWTQKAIPGEVQQADCKSFCIGSPNPHFWSRFHLEVQNFGDATANFNAVGSEWLPPMEADFQTFRGTCSGDDAATKHCLRDKGWADASGQVIGGDPGGFFIWVLPGWSSSRDRNAVSFLWAMSGTGGAFAPDSPSDAAGVLFVRQAAAGDRYLW